MATHSSSCWDNPMDWQATVGKVTKSQTGLKRLSAHTWELYVLLFDFSINLKLLLKKIKCIKKKKKHERAADKRAENPRPTQETRVGSLSQEDPLEEEMATHCNILAWEIQWTEEPGGLQSRASQRVRTRLRMHTHTQTRTMPICIKKEPSRDLHLLCGVFVCLLSGEKSGVS